MTASMLRECVLVHLLFAGRALAVLAHLMRIGSKNQNTIAACRSVNRMSEGL
jgi:hypothetical protein